MHWQIVQTDDLESKFIGLEPVQKLFVQFQGFGEIDGKVVVE